MVLLPAQHFTLFMENQEQASMVNPVPVASQAIPAMDYHNHANLFSQLFALQAHATRSNVNLMIDPVSPYYLHPSN